MALSTQVIGQSMTHGYAGSYARQPDSVIDTHPMASAEDTTPITFGLGVVLDDANAVTLPEDTSTASAVFRCCCSGNKIRNRLLKPVRRTV